MNCEPKLDWDCDRDGCFNIKKRLKFHVFKDALRRGGLPESISFSDLDGFFERHGYFFLIEWKDPCAKLKAGQEIAFSAFTALSEKIVVFVVAGDAEFMTCESWVSFYNGRRGNQVTGNMDEFCALIENWASVAECRTFNQETISRFRAGKGLAAIA